MLLYIIKRPSGYYFHVRAKAWQRPLITFVRPSTKCSLNKWNFLFCERPRSCSLILRSQLNMALMGFFSNCGRQESFLCPGVTPEDNRLLKSVCLLLSRFKKGFESEPTLHSGINYAVLLLAAGHQFDSSFELRKVGEWRPGIYFLHLHLTLSSTLVTTWRLLFNKTCTCCLYIVRVSPWQYVMPWFILHGIMEKCENVKIQT